MSLMATIYSGDYRRFFVVSMFGFPRFLVMLTRGFGKRSHDPVGFEATEVTK